MELPAQAATMTLRGATLFPHAVMPLYIFEPRYRRMLKDCLMGNRMFAVGFRSPETESDAPMSVAGLGLIRASVENSDGTSNLVLEGLCRIALGAMIKAAPYPVYKIASFPDKNSNPVRSDALAGRLLDLADERLRSAEASDPHEGKKEQYAVLRHQIERLRQTMDCRRIADVIAALTLPDPHARQAVLQTEDVTARLFMTLEFLKAGAPHEP